MKNEIKQLVGEAIGKAYPDIKAPDFVIEEADAKFGDYATNVAMILAKAVGDSPEKIAGNIIAQLKTSNDIIAEATFAKPGFINFKIALPFLQKKVFEVTDAGKSYGHSDLGKDLKVNIEFISANPTGPLTLGNGRGGYGGDCLANVFKAYGAEVEREYYINDCGVQITALGHSVLKDGEAVYKGSYIDEIAPKIKSKNPTEAGYEAAMILVEESIRKTIAKMGIEFNNWYSEKELTGSGKVAECLEKLKKLKLTYEKDGALWLKTSQYGDDKDRVIINSKGEHTYFVSDIAYHYDKIHRGYDILIDFWGADHHGYLGRMKAAVEILRNEENWNGKLEIIIAQLVRLMESGVEVKMSKRAGTFVSLDELIAEVGPDVTRYFFLERSLNTHMDFDLKLAKEKSQKNPVYYIQYAHARIASILAKIKNQKSKIKINEADLLLKHPAEISLIKELIKLPEIVQEIVGDYQTQKLATYAYQVASVFHNFYENCPIIEAGSDELTSARVQLLKATQVVLKNTLDLMGISAPTKM